MSKNIKSYIILLPITWFLLGYIVLPLIDTIFFSFSSSEPSYSIENYTDFVFSNYGWNIILNTLFLGVCSVISCGILGTLLALLTNMFHFRNKRIIHALLMVPMMIPGVLIIVAYIQVYGESGVFTLLMKNILGDNFPFLSGMSGIIFIHCFTQYVYFYTNVSVSLSYLDASQIEAAKSFGASKFQIFIKVIIPEILPAIFSSITITFISAIGSLSAPNLIGGVKVLSTQILYSKTNNYLNIASMQVVLLLMMGLSVLFLMRYYEQKHQFQRNTRAVLYEGIKIKGKILKFTHSFVLIGIIIVIVSPIIAMTYLSFIDSSSIMSDLFPRDFTFDNYNEIFGKKRVYEPFINSIYMGILAILGGLAISIPIAYFSTKRRNKLTFSLEVIPMIAIAIPVSSIAVNLINYFNVPNIFAFGTSLIGTFIILPIAYTIISIPVLLRTNIIAISKFNDDFEKAGRSLGCNNLNIYTKILIPLVSPSILKGAMMMFVRILGEYNLSSFLYGIHNKPISIAMVNAVQKFDIGLSMSYGTLTILISLFAVILAEYFGKKSLKYNLGD